MQYKKIYFVRHAESHMNAQGLLHQYEEGHLSEFGIQQAQSLAHRFKDIPIDVILSSPYERTKATSDLLMAQIQSPAEYHDILREFSGPREIEGKAKNDPTVLAVDAQLLANRHDPHWRHSDEETYHELTTRADNVCTFLAARPENHILCVTHGLFLRVILAIMLFGLENMKREQMLRLMSFISISNTGITVCEQRQDRWKLITLNDLSHLN